MPDFRFDQTAEPGRRFVPAAGQDDALPHECEWPGCSKTWGLYRLWGAKVRYFCATHMHATLDEAAR